MDTPAAAAEMAENLKTCRQLAVDTESNSLFAYREQVCLIQFSTGVQDYLVDPLAVDDLSLLGPIFSNPGIEKIFHAAEYDIICMKRDFGFTFANIFDTMLAARILQYEAIGLAAMLETEFGIVLDKRYQRANWAERPLSEDQKAYARLDSYYLIDLRNRLYNALEEKRLLDLAGEDFERLTHVHANNSENGLAHFWKLAVKENLGVKELSVLYEVYQYRDRVARARNRPVFKVLGDQTLLEISEVMPLNRDMLACIIGMNKHMLGIHTDGVLAAVQRGLAGKPPQRPARPHPGSRFIGLHEALRNWRKEKAKTLGIESDIVLPRDVMEIIAKEAPANREQLQKIMADLPWRFSQYGQEVLEIIRKGE